MLPSNKSNQTNHENLSNYSFCFLIYFNSNRFNKGKNSVSDWMRIRHQMSGCE